MQNVPARPTPALKHNTTDFNTTQTLLNYDDFTKNFFKTTFASENAGDITFVNRLVFGKRP